MRRLIQGQGASRGLALGRARVREPHTLEIVEQRIEPEAVEAEVARLHQALLTARDELAGLRERLHGVLAKELGDFLDLHALILDDPELRVGLENLVRSGRYSAEYALWLQHDRLAAVFEAMDDPYFRSRREDLDQVIGRVQAALHRQAATLPAGASGEILVTPTASPAELAQLQAHGVVAVIVERGSPLSHSAILARSLHLPLVLGGSDALKRIADGDVLMVDGGSGEVVVDPDPADLRRYRGLLREQARERQRLQRLRQVPSRTRDGTEIDLLANAESREDVHEAHALGAAGIGLYRTEFLFLQRSTPPDEDEQFLAYRDLVLAMSGRPVTIRTLDLGADKADGSGLALAAEPNPALGLRGLRLSLARPDLFRTQLRAVLRASAYGPVRLLLPMVGRREELIATRKIIAALARDLRTQGHAHADRVPLGAMIEVPAAALALPALLDQLEFVAIGTNDLVQYLLAVDRNHPGLAELYSPLHPAVLDLLHTIIGRCRQHGAEATVCGEIAGDARLTPLLLALGLTRLSLHPGTLLEVREAVRACDLAALRRRAGALLRARDRAAIEHWLHRCSPA